MELYEEIMKADDLMFEEKEDEIRQLRAKLRNQNRLEYEIAILKGKLKIARFKINKSKTKQMKERLKFAE